MNRWNAQDMRIAVDLAAPWGLLPLRPAADDVPAVAGWVLRPGA